jgi:glycosyltransferase involved in cell wall biosynthesis
MSKEIVRAIQSIKTQEEMIFEHIIVDDCSSYESYSELTECIKVYSNLSCKIIRNEINIGPLKSANIGAIEASGDLLIFLSADDEIDSNICVEIIDAYKQYPYAGGFVGDLKINYIDEKTSYIIKPVNSEKIKFIPSAFKYFIREPVHGGMAIRRDKFLELGMYDARLKWYADTILHLILLQKYGVVYIPKIQLVFYKNPNTFGAKSNSKSDEQLVVFKELFTTLDENIAVKDVVQFSGMLGKLPNSFFHIFNARAYEYLNIRYLLTYIFFKYVRVVRKIWRVIAI